MKTSVVSITTDKTVSEALSLMRKKRVDALFIVDAENKLMGFVTIQGVADEDDLEKKVTEIMLTSARPLKETTLIQNQMRQVLKRAQSAIPVVDDQRHLTGVLTKATLVNLVYDIIWDQSTAQEEILEITPTEGKSE